MDGTVRLMAAACAGALLLACSGRQTTVPVDPIPALSADAYYVLGRTEHAARRFDAAHQAWRRALRIDPHHGDTLNGMAVLLAGQGKYAEAIVLWRMLVKESRAQPRATQAFLLGNLGYALFLKGERDEALAMLKRACVLDPSQPVTWEHLASVLEAVGQTGRALQMMKQARTLRTHDIRRDYALTGASDTAASAADAPAPRRASPWPEDMPRTELRQVGAVVEVHRVAAHRVAEPVEAPPVLPAVRQAAMPAATQPVANAAMQPVTMTVAQAKSEPEPVVESEAAPQSDSAAAGGVRLEISNGNGVRGMAANWARRLQGPQWKSVRLTNVKPFSVARTRIEHARDPDATAVAQALAERLGLPAPKARPDDAPAGRSDLRIVLGWDQRTATAQVR